MIMKNKNNKRFSQLMKLMRMVNHGIFVYPTEPQQALYNRLHKILLFGVYGITDRKMAKERG